MSEGVRAGALDRDAERALDVVRKHPSKGKLASLCFDLLSRQAEGRTLLTGQKLVEQRLSERDLTESEADTEAGNPVRILARGPDTPLEHALVAAFAIRGLGDSFDGLDADARREQLERFARHLEWLESATAYRPGPLLEQLLSPSLAEEVYASLARAVRRDDAEPVTPAGRARQSVRLSLLGETALGGARVELRGLLDELRDPFTRAAAAAALGMSEPPPPRVQVLHGRPGRVPAARPLALLRWLTGWALVSWLARAVGHVFGLRRRAELELGDRALTMRRTTTLLGRVVRESELVHPLGRLDSARRRVRYPALPMLLGVVFFSVGLLLGGFLMADGFRAGNGPLIALAGGILFLGAGIDLALDVLLPGRRGRVVLEVSVGRERLRMWDVPRQEADGLLGELARRLPPAE